MRPLRLVLGVLLSLVVAPQATSAASGYSAGFGQAITTPPVWAKDATAAQAANAKYAPGFATCPAALYPDHGVYALQEPFKDTDGNGQWSSGASPDGTISAPPEPYCDANGNGQQDGGELGVAGVSVTLVGGGQDGLVSTTADNTGVSTTTDANGNYSLEVPAGNDNTLVYGYGGYDDEVVRSTNNKFMNVTLTPRAKSGGKKRR